MTKFKLHLFHCRKGKKKHRNLFWLGFCSILFVFSCQSKVSSDIPPELIEGKSFPALDAVNFETTRNDSGVVRYHLTTPRLLHFKEERNPRKEAYYEFPEGFHLQIFNKNSQIESELSGNYGKLKWIDNNKWMQWYASGNVIMTNSQSDTLRTEELNYHQKEDLIFSDKFVSIKKGDQYFNGAGGFKSDAQMTKWSFMQTRGHIYMEEE